MHAASKIGSFMALRANGWSLAKISKELNVSKSTLWDWDNQNKNEIHLLKHLQLEKLQEKYLPTYEEELSKLRSYLDRLESALETQDFSKMGPEYVLQMALQLRARLGKMREQVPLRPVPFNEPIVPLPFTGCVSRQDAQTFKEEFAEGQSVEDPADEVGRAVPSAPSCEVGRGVPAEPSSPEVGRDSAEPSAPPVAAPTESADQGEKSSHVVPAGTSRCDRGSAGPEVSAPSASSVLEKPSQNGNDPISVDPCPSVVNSSDTNRTFPDETPPGVKNRPLILNDLRNGQPNGRPVLHSENGHANSNGNGNGNGRHE